MKKDFSEVHEIKHTDYVIFTWKDHEKWILKSISGNVKELTGYEKDEFLSNCVDYMKLIDKNDIKRVRDEFKINYLNEKHEFKHKPYNIITKNGKNKMVEHLTFINKFRGKNRGIFETVIYEKDDLNCSRCLINIQEKFIESISKFETIDELLKFTLDTIIANTSFEAGTIHLIDEDESGLSLRCHSGLRKEFVDKIKNHYKNEDNFKLLKSYPANSYQIVKDNFDNETIKEENFTNLGILPIRNLKHKLIGTINIATYNDVSISKLDKNIISIISTSCRSIIENFIIREKLKISEKKYRMVFENSPILIALSDPTTSKVIEANRLLRELSQKSEEELWGLNFSEIFPEISDNDTKNSELVKKINNEVRKNGISKNLDVKIRTKNNENYHLSISATNFFINNKEFAITTGIDITQNKVLENINKNLWSSLENSLMGILITDIDGNILYTNKRFSNLTLYTSEELIGKNPKIFKSGETSPEVYKKMWKTLTTGSIWYGEFKNKNKNGNIYYEFTIIIPLLTHDDKIKGYMGIKSDITDKKRIEKRLNYINKMESIEKLAGGISHELNNMFAVIYGYTEDLLELSSKDSQCYQELLEIKKASIRSIDIIKKLLSFAKIKDSNPKNLNLCDEIRKSQSIFKKVVGENIKINYNFPEKIWNVKFDPDKLTQVIINLLINSSEAMKNSGTIDMNFENFIIDSTNNKNGEMNIGEYVKLSIIDRGKSIDEEIMDRIFEPFFSTKGIGEGSGLGLSMVYGIIKQHNGYIYIKNNENIGVEVSIFLPKSEFSLEYSTDENISYNKLEKKILIVDDDKMVKKLTEKILVRAGFNVIVSRDSEDALNLFKNHNEEIEILLTDVAMPQMDGLELSKKVLDINKNTKIIYMSGYTDDIIAGYGMLKEGENFIEKPFSKKELLKIIYDSLEK